MNKDAKIYIAGHRGLVGQAMLRQLRVQGHNNLVLRSSHELDLSRQSDVCDFFADDRPDYVFDAAASGDYVLNFYEKAIGRGGIINAGAYWIDRDIIKEITDPPCSLENDIFPALSKRRLIRGFVYSGKFIDIGVPEDLVRAQKVLD